MAFGRIIYWVTPESHRGIRHIWIPARFMSLIFMLMDGLSFVIQCIGVFVLIGSLSKSDLTTEQQDMAVRLTYNILKVGFILQVMVYGLFTVIAVRFMVVSKQWKYDWPISDAPSWRHLAWVITICTSMIMVRNLRFFVFGLSTSILTFLSFLLPGTLAIPLLPVHAQLR